MITAGEGGRTSSDVIDDQIAQLGAGSAPEAPRVRSFGDDLEALLQMATSIGNGSVGEPHATAVSRHMPRLGRPVTSTQWTW